MLVFNEVIDIKVSPHQDVNILCVESYNEIFYDLYEIVINKNKYTCARVGWYNDHPIVECTITINDNEETVQCILYQNDKSELIINPTIKSIESQFLLEEVQEKAIESSNNNSGDDLIDEIRQHATPYNEKFSSDTLTKFISNKEAVIDDKLERSTITILEEFANSIDKSQLQFEHKLEEFQYHINRQLEITESKLNNLITEEVSEREKLIFEQILAKLNNIVKLAIIPSLNTTVQEYEVKLNTAASEISSELNKSVSNLIEETNTEFVRLADSNKQLIEEAVNVKIIKFEERLAEAVKVIDDSYNKRFEEVNKLNIREKNKLSSIIEQSKKDFIEQLNKVQKSIPQLVTEQKNVDKDIEKRITDRFNAEMTNLKRYISLLSGGGSGSVSNVSTTTQLSNIAIGSNIAPYSLIISGPTSSSPLSGIANSGNAGYILTSNGAGSPPSYQSIGQSALLKANNLSDVTSLSTARTNLQLQPGVDIQQYSSFLTSLTALSGSSNAVPYFTSTGAVSSAPAQTAGLAILSCASANQQRFNLNLNRILPIPFTSAIWSAGTVAGAGTVNVNAITYAHVISIQTAANSVMARQYAGLSSSANWLPGSNSSINFGLPFRLSFVGGFRMGGVGAKFSLIAGGLSVAPIESHALSAKGFRISIDGTGTQTGVINCSVHNGSTQTDGLTASVLANHSLIGVELQWIPTVGAYLYVDNTLVSSVTANLPTGTVGANGWTMLLSNPASSSYVTQSNVYPILVYL